MPKRITDSDLRTLARIINKQTNSPQESWDKTPEGKNSSIPGHYHIDHAYGGVALYRMANEHGGVHDVSRMGHVPKRELYIFMNGFLAGLDADTEDSD